jgi:surfeit locus 1 family protein
LTVAAILLMIITFRLAWWQFDRANEKRVLEQHAQAGLRAEPLTVTTTVGIAPHRSAVVSGQYLPSHEILLDNQVHQRRAGFHVITPLRLAGGDVIAINRGWVAGDVSSRTAVPLPPPTGKVTVRGVLQKDRSDAFTLSEQTENGNVWQNLQLPKYAATTGLPLLTLVLFAQDGDGVLAPAAVRINFKSAQSTAYAWQWLTFCALTLLFYILLGLKRKES